MSKGKGKGKLNERVLRLKCEEVLKGDSVMKLRGRGELVGVLVGSMGGGSRLNGEKELRNKEEEEEEVELIWVGRREEV